MESKLVSAGSAEPTLRENIEPPPAVSRVIVHRDLSKNERKKLQARYTHPDHVAFFKEQEASGEYDIDLKIDRTEIIRQQKQQEQEALRQRNQTLEDHARQLEKDFNDYKATTEARFDKIAQMLKGAFKSSS